MQREYAEQAHFEAVVVISMGPIDANLGAANARSFENQRHAIAAIHCMIVQAVAPNTDAAPVTKGRFLVRSKPIYCEIRPTTTRKATNQLDDQIRDRIYR